MEKFTTLTAIAAQLPMANVDTDKILAGQFLKTITREGLGDKLFHTMRYAKDGSERPEFVLNRPPWREAGILIALDNFGCGSSREHAPWALLDFGIRCIIATSFADIFYNNCFKNGILPIALEAVEVHRLMEFAADPRTATMTISLPEQRIKLADGTEMAFDIAPERKHALLEGTDDIDTTLEHLSEIEAWEGLNRDLAPPISNDERIAG